MNKLALVFALLFSSCGYGKLLDKLHSKGYTTERDTVIINPYEYLIVQKGYTAQYKELFPEKKMDLKISIKGYEDTDSIALGSLVDTFRLTISDSSVREIVSGELHFKIRGAGFVNQIKTQNIDNLYFAYRFFADRRKYPKPLVLFFWNVKVKKNDIVYSIPARKYSIELRQ